MSQRVKQFTSIGDKQATIEMALLRRKPRRSKAQMQRASRRSKAFFYPWLKGEKTSAPLDRWAEKYLNLPKGTLKGIANDGQD